MNDTFQFNKLLSLLCAFALIVGGGACTESGGPPDADDGCTDANDCDQQTVGEIEVSTMAMANGFRSELSGPAGAAEIEWVNSNGRTTFRYKPADGALGPEVVIDGTPANVEAVSEAAALLYSYDIASRDDSTGKFESTDGDPRAAKYTGPNGVANTAGCDQLHGLDCSAKGICCDVHDECINANCSGQGGCGNVLLALQAGYTDQPCDAPCLECHGAVVACFLGAEPGPSHCCDAGDCGRAQECMIDGVVITDPCKCEDAGIDSVSPCLRVCRGPDDPCIPDGEFSLRACNCCSGMLRITNPDGGGECFTR
ncbi:MAG TPA: hypothetical protein PKN33_15245 [Phycisphaerae bacterium]|nr:hypothetical protein [Phycisphaerae bacterium]